MLLFHEFISEGHIMWSERRSFFVFLLFLTVPAQAQQGPQAAGVLQSGHDPQAVSVLNQALSVAGGAQVLGAISDFTGTGKITYYWGGQEIQGNVTVKGRGTGQFRLVASLPDGVQTLVVNNGEGFLTPSNGDVQPLQWHNAINFGSLTFPITHIAASLVDSSTAVSYVGLEAVASGQAHHIRLQRVPRTQNSLDLMLARLTARDYFIDATTFRV